jgi:hypothetical protein
MTSADKPIFSIKFYIFDRKKVLTSKDENDLMKILENLEDIVRNALSNTDIKLHILDRAEDVSFATLDNKKQLRSEIFLGKGKSLAYDRHCIHLIQHGEELFTIEELMTITKAIKDELHAYLCYDFDTEIYLSIF